MPSMDSEPATLRSLARLIRKINEKQADMVLPVSPKVGLGNNFPYA